MVNGRPLFPGDTDANQLQKIFKILGTPSAEIWPTITELPDWKPDFAVFEPQSWTVITPSLDVGSPRGGKRILEFEAEGTDLIAVLLPRFKPTKQLLNITSSIRLAVLSHDHEATQLVVRRSLAFYCLAACEFDS